MPGEVIATPPVATGTTPKSIGKLREARASSTASSTYAKLADGCSKEFFWGCELTKDKKEFSWNYEEEDDDQDFLVHTLFLRHVVLGVTSGKEERNIIELETKAFNGETIKQPIASVWKGHDMCQLDLNFSHELSATFRLVEGSGPVYLSGQHLVEFPTELNESEYTATETDITDEEEEEEEEEVEEVKKGTKRKGNTVVTSKKKRGKIDSECTEEDDEEEEDESDEEESMEEDEEEESEEPESSPEKITKKGKKGKATAVTKPSKKEKAAPVVAKGKKGKKGKAK